MFQPSFMIGFRDNEWTRAIEEFSLSIHDQGQHVVRNSPVLGAREWAMSMPG